MVTKEKLGWLKENRKWGDIKKVSEQTGVNPNTVLAILHGTMYGTHGQVVIDAATNLITEREKMLDQERKTYAKALDQQ